MVTTILETKLQMYEPINKLEILPPAPPPKKKKNYQVCCCFSSGSGPGWG